MPRYHFHLVDGYQLSDVKGVDLPNDEAARRHAEELSRSAFGDQYRAIRVIGENGKEISRIPLTGRTGDRHNSN